MQIDQPERGFSYLRDGPLDMRMDPESGEGASALLSRLDESAMRELLRDFGEVRRPRRVARPPRAAPASIEAKPSRRMTARPVLQTPLLRVPGTPALPLT